MKNGSDDRLNNNISLHRRRMRKKLLSLTLVFTSLVSGAAYGVEWAEWNFSSDFDINDEIVAESSSDADSLICHSVGTSAFSISGGILTCTQTGPNDYLRIDVDDLQFNGGGGYVNEYTLIFDVNVDNPDWLPLYNTGYDNHNDAELWLRSDGAVGDGGLYTASGVVTQSTWTRLVVTRYLDSGTWYRKIFTDGSLKASGLEPEGTDGNLSLYTNGQQDAGQFTILSDYDATVYGGCKLGNFAFISEAMSDANIAALGGYDPNGIGVGGGAEEPDMNFDDFKAGPYVHFTKKAEVTVYWKTETAVPSVLEYGVGPNLDQTVEDSAPKTDHELTITGLNPETNYNYRIDVNGLPAETYEFYSAFDFGPEPFPAGASPYPTDSLTSLYEQAAEYIINTSGITKGVCIDYSCGRGRLAYELAKRSDLKIIGFEEDANKVAEARNYLDEAGIYGVRVTVLAASLASLNCRDYSANLIVSDKMIADGNCPGSSTEMFRVLRPAGGVAYLGQPPSCPNSLSQATLESWLSRLSYNITQDSNGLWANVTRGALDGAGEWTHFYADLANTANSGETNIQNSMKVLWYGQPGPRYITDRHNRPMSSLYKNGTVVTPGINRIMAFDAYNGCRYWDVAFPESTRAAILRDCGWVALANDYVYVANKDDCVGLDLNTGQPTIYLTTPTVDANKLNWGYLAVVDDKVFGSGQKDGASLIGHSRANVYDAYYDNKPIATSNYLFCLNRHTGSQLWTYKRTGGSAIINPAIAIGGDYIYFIESRNPNAINDDDGRVTASVLMSGNNEYLVKLNKTTGLEATAKQINLPFEHIVYLSYTADDSLVVAVGSHNDPGCRYEHYAYNLSDLSLAWNSDYYQGSTGGGHGEQDQHPVIVGSIMYSRYYELNLSNGNVTPFPLSRGNCGTQSACSTHLFGRKGNPYIYELPAGTPVRMTNETRPGCWINMIPAGGLLLIPESSAGCTCDYPIQTSMAFMPE